MNLTSIGKERPARVIVRGKQRGRSPRRGEEHVAGVARGKGGRRGRRHLGQWRTKSEARVYRSGVTRADVSGPNLNHPLLI